LMRDANRLTSPFYDDIIKLVELRFRQLGQSIGGKLSVSLDKENIDDDELPLAIVEFMLLRFKEPKRLLFNNVCVC
ncbi:unnamed protein product, partial [Didymodactylos carnosus]